MLRWRVVAPAISVGPGHRVLRKSYPRRRHCAPTVAQHEGTVEHQPPAQCSAVGGLGASCCCATPGPWAMKARLPPSVSVRSAHSSGSQEALLGSSARQKRQRHVGGHKLGPWTCEAQQGCWYIADWTRIAATVQVISLRGAAVAGGEGAGTVARCMCAQACRVCVFGSPRKRKFQQAPWPIICGNQAKF